MNIIFKRRLDRIVGSFLCWVISLFHLTHRKISPPVKPTRILVILLSEMGSLVLAYPMFRHIKNKFPNASIYILLFERNRELLEILDVVPARNIITIEDTSMVRFIMGSVTAVRRIKKVKFDAVIDCELFSRISSIFSFFSGAKKRAGFHPYTQEGLYRGNFITRPVLYNPYHHISQQFITLVEAIDSNEVPLAKSPVQVETIKLPLVSFSQDEIKGMVKRLYGEFPQIMGKKLVLIYPSGGSLPIRAWPLSYFCYLSSELVRSGYAVGVIGLKGDQEIANSIVAYCQNPSCIALAGHTRSMQELLILFYVASLLITNDGGPGQCAAITPVPTIILYGPETPTLYRSLDEEATVFYVPFTCSPCLTAFNHRNSPCDGNNLCLKSIHPDKVLEAALKILEHQDPQK